MERTNDSEKQGKRESSSEQKPHIDRTENQLKPTPENPLNGPNESAFKRAVKKIGYSVWLIVMVVGAALAFVAALFLL